MLHITQLSGEELARIPVAEIEDVRSLKLRLHQRHGLPTRFRQKLVHEGRNLDDDEKLDTAMDLTVLVLAFVEPPVRPPRLGLNGDPMDNLYPKEILTDASVNGDVDEVEELLSLPLDPNVPGVIGPPLMRASEYGRIQTVQKLLESDVQLDLRGGREGWTALTHASWRERVEICRLLLQARAQVDLPRADGSTALMLAAQRGYHEVAKVLLEHGAETELRDSQGRRAFEIATEHGHVEVEILLLEAQVKREEEAAVAAHPA
ncbi:Ankyrin repeat domain-containing protein 50 [Symbiodinium microadriaticum]|uniref:Ankyrin repeat domain-containing protein 50 n=1 Tax=Symbiodinium microadriaticum TaxID=2951 RepID=A0A1Q9C3T4_SYMMI|nr:Ankyrin repeat domain-containing protein 50 [Symbiodinium microadriaticum]CAE7946390.1 ANKRD50 [Symbiodinium sp. KB8]